jgi:hypothetical protein
VRLEYDDGTGDFPVDNDYRRIMLIRDPFNFGTTVVSTATTLKATKELTINTAVSTFLEDEIITGGTSGAVGRIINIAVGGSTTTIRYIQLSEDAGNVNGADFATAEVITGTTSLSAGTISALSNPEVEPFSGDVLYVENRRLINRAPDQIEDIKIIVEM